MTQLVWLRRPGTGSLVAQIKEHLTRIELLHSVGAGRFDVRPLASARSSIHWEPSQRLRFSDQCSRRMLARILSITPASGGVSRYATGPSG